MDIPRRLRAIEKTLDENPYLGYSLMKYAKLVSDCEIAGIDLSPWKKRTDAIRKKMFEKVSK